MRATVKASGKGHVSQIVIDGDPYPVEVRNDQLTTTPGEKINDMATKTTKSASAKELRREAKNAGIAGWEGMGKDELIAALATTEGAAKETATRRARRPEKESTTATRKTKTKSVKSTKSKSAKAKSRPARASTDGANPFRAGTNLWHITEALMRGGKRSDLVRRLEPKLNFNPRKVAAKDFDVADQIDRRLKHIGYILKNDHGFEYVHEGRGVDAFIKVTPPA